MTFREYLIKARDELLRDGARPVPLDILTRALEMEGGSAAFFAERDKNARAKALREASSLLSDVEGQAADPAIAALFDVTQYEPPRAITFKDDEGVLRHVAIEHATRSEADGYIEVLEGNIVSAVKRRDAWRGFRRQIEPYLGQSPTAKIVDALRRMQRAAA